MSPVVELIILLRRENKKNMAKTKLKSPLKAKTVQRLRKLQKYILDEPKRFNLETWGEVCNPKTYAALEAEYVGADVVNQKPPCGTVGCIAGNLCVLSGDIKPNVIIDRLGSELETYIFPRNTDEMAAKYLGLDIDEAEKLFYLEEWNYGTGWPEEFAARLEKHKPGTLEYAKVAVARIDHFIETGE